MGILSRFAVSVLKGSKTVVRHGAKQAAKGVKGGTSKVFSAAGNAARKGKR